MRKCTASAALFLTASLVASGQYLPSALPAFTNVAARGSTTSGTNTINSGAKRPIDVPQMTSLVLLSTYSAGEAGTSNVVLYFNGAVDVAQWTTDYPLSVTVACNGTNVITTTSVVGTNLNYRFLSLDKYLSQQTNNVTFSTLTYQFLPR